MQKQSKNRSGGVYRFSFDPSVDIRDVEYVLDLSIAAMTAMSGEAAVRLGFAYSVAREHHSVAIDVRSEIGMNVVLVFVGLSILSFGGDRVSAERLGDNQPSRATRKRASSRAKKDRHARPRRSPILKLSVRGRHRAPASRPARSPR